VNDDSNICGIGTFEARLPVAVIQTTSVPPGVPGLLQHTSMVSPTSGGMVANAAVTKPELLLWKNVP
jgi:hypothetical protein